MKNSLFRRIAALVLAMIVACGTLIGCGGNKQKPGSQKQQNPTTQQSTQKAPEKKPAKKPEKKPAQQNAQNQSNAEADKNAADNGAAEKPGDAKPEADKNAANTGDANNTAPKVPINKKPGSKK